MDNVDNLEHKNSEADKTDTIVKLEVSADAKAGIHKTSIEATKGSLVGLRPTKATLEGWHIEAVHIVMFFGILVFLFVGMWINGKKTKF